MERRDFLRLGTAGAIAGTTLSPLQAMANYAPPPMTTYDPDNVEQAIDRIDATMASIMTLDLGLRTPRNAAEKSHLAKRTRLLRSSMRTLYFTGAVLELAEQDRMHPGIQMRVERMAPEMDEAVEGITQFMEGLSDAERKDAQAQLRANPELGTHVGERFHQVIKDDGFSFARRLDLRLAFANVAERMRTQNPSLVIDSCVSKVRRTQAHPLTHAEYERTMRVRLGEQAFWELQQRTDKHLQNWDAVYRDRPRRYVAALDDTYPQEPANQKNAGQRAGAGTLKVALWTMGIGAVITGLGGLAYLVGLQDVAIVLGVTIGPLTFIAGVLLLVIGTLIYAVGSIVQTAKRRRTHEGQAPEESPPQQQAPAPAPTPVAPAPSPAVPTKPTPSPTFDPNEPPPSYE